MSRSRSKNPIYNNYHRGNNGTKKSKRLASKKVRRYKGVITDGNLYRKIYPSYDIFDQQGYWDEPEQYRK